MRMLKGKSKEGNWWYGRESEGELEPCPGMGERQDLVHTWKGLAFTRAHLSIQGRASKLWASGQILPPPAFEWCSGEHSCRDDVCPALLPEPASLTSGCQLATAVAMSGSHPWAENLTPATAGPWAVKSQSQNGLASGRLPNLRRQCSPEEDTRASLSAGQGEADHGPSSPTCQSCSPPGLQGMSLADGNWVQTG